MKAILVSKRFHPGHFSHILANALLFQEANYEVLLDIHPSYEKLESDVNLFTTVDFFDWLNLSKSDVIVIWAPSITAIFLLFFASIRSSATKVYIYHEPFTSFHSYRASGFSFFKTLRVYLISLVNKIICSLSNKIILPSTRAYSSIYNSHLMPNRYAKINLMFSDENGPNYINLPRNFISYIGTIAEDHAFDEFFRLMHESISGSLLSRFNFLIASRSQLPEKYLLLADNYVSSGRLTLHIGTSMSNDQINSFYSMSFVVWNAYKRSMQSGVLPKAYMFSTPILISTSNTSEYFQDGVHGILISDRYSIDEFIQAIIKLQKIWPKASLNCRNYFLTNFHYASLSNDFMNFIRD